MSSNFETCLRLAKKAKQVLVRMNRGDQLREYPTRIFLHTSDLKNRPSIELRRNTVQALVDRGLAFPVREQEVFNYELTEEGETIARVIERQSFA